ncbi:cytochrome P450, partial [Aureobasidium melanogenum]
MITALIFGPTGAVGSQILATLLSSYTCTSLTTISRRAPQTQTQVSKLKTIIEADTAKWGPMISTLSPAPSVVFNAVGTTMASAGSIAAQRAIDHDLCIENAKAAKAAGVKTYVYCSSAGTSGSFSPFALTPYAKMKRGVENAIKELDFENAIILRPGMILGRESPKNKWLEDIFDGFKKISQGFQDKWAQDQTTIGRAAVAAMKIVEEGKAPEKFWVLEQSDIVWAPGQRTIHQALQLYQFLVTYINKNEYLQFTKWAREYGPVYSIMVGSRPMIVLSSVEVVKELLEKRSAIYSDRPEAYAAKHIPTSKLRIVFMPYTPLWRKLPKVTHSLLSIKAARNYDPYQEMERKQMLDEILINPNDVFSSLQRYTTSLTATLLYGWRSSSTADPRLHKLDNELAALQAALGTTAAALLDAFPIMRFLPDSLLPVKKRVHRALHMGHDVHMENWYAVKENIKNGTLGHCMSIGLARAQDKDNITDVEAAYAVGNIFEGGMETTAATLYAFIQAMLLFPEVQTKAQEEIDRVVGPGRLPVMADAANLPYVRRCVKELVRWFPVAPLGAVPHACTQDDEYMGYKIPKGAPVILNAWAIMTDPDRYTEPRRFNPDRFTEDSDSISMTEMAAHPDPSKRDTVGFGAGRRLCPGMHVADRSLFLGITGILWSFSVTPKKDAQGQDILPNADNLIVGLAARPEPFEVSILSRNEKRACIIREEWKDAQRLLDPEKQWMETPEGDWDASLRI